MINIAELECGLNGMWIQQSNVGVTCYMKAVGFGSSAKTMPHLALDELLMRRKLLMCAQTKDGVLPMGRTASSGAKALYMASFFRDKGLWVQGELV